MRRGTKKKKKISGPKKPIFKIGGPKHNFFENRGDQKCI